MEYTRPIDAVAYRKKLEEEKICCERSDEFLSGLEVAIADLGDIETAEVTSIKQGKWEVSCRGKMRDCSVCKTSFDATCNFIDEEWQYCPGCGARMNRGNAYD